MNKKVTIGNLIEQVRAGMKDPADEVASLGTWCGHDAIRYEVHLLDAEGKRYSIPIEYDKNGRS